MNNITSAKEKLKTIVHLVNEFNKPLVISGPCSAESKDQLINTAKQLSEIGIKVFRAGIWKPRSRPGNFNGCGSIGLRWLKDVKLLTGMLTAVEVATKNHIEEALKNDVDILWIGARTTVNPFAVQELVDAMKGIKNPILIKNPINPDLDLWIGAIERFFSAGISNIGLVHRGFSLYKKSKFRNEPLWQIPLDIKERFPELPIFCDPSHICGNTEFIYEVSQKALDLNFDGLMIESHIDPSNALSDSQQQITPNGLNNLLNSLKVRNQNISYLDSLESLRKVIDEKDEELIKILSERMDIAKSIGEIKKENNILILQNDRWKNIMKKMILLGKRSDLQAEFVQSIFKLIHQESIYHQSQIMNKD